VEELKAHFEDFCVNIGNWLDLWLNNWADNSEHKLRQILQRIFIFYQFNLFTECLEEHVCQIYVTLAKLLHNLFNEIYELGFLFQLGQKLNSHE